jgi:hypothetical protein
MAGNGSPEPAAILLGQTIARLRSKRNWSRATLVRKIYGKLSEEDELVINEESLKDLEEGAKVKIPRRLIDILMNGLECTPAERLEILVAADRNILNDGTTGSSRESDFFHRILQDIYYNPIARVMLNSLLEGQEVQNLNPKEMIHILSSIVELSDDKSFQKVAIPAKASQVKTR